MSKKKGAKDKAPVVVEVEQPIVVEPEPEPVVIQLSETEIKSIQNKERVAFRKPVVKHIVSPHSGSLLADSKVIVSDLPTDIEQAAVTAFESMAIEQLIEKNKLSDLLLKTGFTTDNMEMLNQLIDEFCGNSRSSSDKSTDPTTIDTSIEKIDMTSYLDFLRKFYASPYHNGERLRRYSSRNESDAVKKLLLRKCDVNTADGEGTTSLHYCSEYNRPDMINILSSPPTPSSSSMPHQLVVDAKDRYGWTPLHSAAFQGNISCVELLLKLNANVNVVNNQGKSALHLAATQGRSAICALLLEKGADINLQDQQGMTPIHEAGYRGQVTVYNELIRDVNAKMDLRDALNNLPIDYYQFEN